MKELIFSLETMPFIAVWLSFTFLLVLFATKWVRSLALRKNIIDVPNSRSSHKTPTPRGGGLAFVLGISMGHSVLFFHEGSNLWLLCLHFSSLLIAFIGWIDDQISLSPQTRLILQLVATLVLLIPFQPFSGFSFHMTDFPNWAYWVMLTLFVMWSINLYNFMDGIDGLAAIQAITVSLGGALLCHLNADPVLCLAFLVVAFACAGFIRWNWMPAKIFSGDAGSTYLGILFAGLMVAAASRETFSLLVGLILMGSFYVDATFTLLFRLGKGQKPHQAHRTHTYQKANQAGYSSRRICHAVALINILWLLPLGVLASSKTTMEVYVFFLACLPLVALSLFFKAGSSKIVGHAP